MKKLYFLFIATLCFGCQKSKEGTGCPAGLRLTPNDSTPVVGDTVVIYANHLNMDYNWSGPDNFFYQSYTGSNGITLAGIQLKQSGWYYCTASEVDCPAVTDSVYIRVKYAQGTPSCSLTNNQVTSTTGIPDFSAVTVTKTYDLSYNAIVLHAFQAVGAPEYDFVFNSYNGNTEPQDGIYYTTSIPSFEPDQDADVINMACNFDGFYYFQSNPGQKVYVSHVNGKLRISFCSIEAGDTDSGVSGQFTGELTEQ
ncbi:hypothetical protein [Dinghuibacter silviterrae]|uniref:Ig-like domain-containing protein n=1 Tax=Dinghuibacter silviterrae TaxID=1539049 RepID=A0A4R8DVT4_9BACT|nr:hypothetical protein [Dinghuibacter silviterrae]TDX02319.1 hypothetical protein EDB95_3375 [Dinghuibacter silviterrae]